MPEQSQSRSPATQSRVAEPSSVAAQNSPEGQRASRAQSRTGNAALNQAAGFAPQGRGVDAAALLRGEGEQVDDPNLKVGEHDVPGVLYSNTSETNLNKKSNWPARLGFALGKAYVATVTLDDLILAGQAIRAPNAEEEGPVKVPASASQKDPLEYDYIETPGGEVRERGAQRFALRGGAGGVGGPVTLRFANNGALNLARLARSAYELAMAKGVTVARGRVDYHGQTFALGCTVQMGNDKEADGARAYGFVGEFDLKWIAEKVSATQEVLAQAVAVALRDVQSEAGAVSGDALAMHPYHQNAHDFQTSTRNKDANGGEMPTTIDWTRFYAKGQTSAPVKPEANQGAWLTERGAITARAQTRLASIWAPADPYAIHPTFITESPDFSGVIAKCLADCQALFTRTPATVAPLVAAAVREVGAQVLKAPMSRPLIEDPELLDRLEKANRGVIAQAFANVGAAGLQTKLTNLSDAQAPPSLKPGEAPLEGAKPNDEGMVRLRDWSSRD